MADQFEDYDSIDDDDFLVDDDFSDDSSIDDDDDKSEERKKLIKIVLLVMLWIVVVGGGFYYLFIYDSSGPKTTTQKSISPEKAFNQEVTKTEFLSSRDPRQDSEDAFQSLLSQKEVNDKLSSASVNEIKALRSDVDSIFSTINRKLDNIPTECQSLPSTNVPANARDRVQFERLNNSLFSWKQKYADLQAECSGKRSVVINPQKPQPFNEQQLSQIKAVIHEVLDERDRQKALLKPQKKEPDVNEKPKSGIYENLNIN